MLIPKYSIENLEELVFFIKCASNENALEVTLTELKALSVEVDKVRKDLIKKELEKVGKRGV